MRLVARENPLISASMSRLMVLATLFTSAASSAVLELDHLNFDSTITKDDLWIIKFYGVCWAHSVSISSGAQHIPAMTHFLHDARAPLVCMCASSALVWPL